VNESLNESDGNPSTRDPKTEIRKSAHRQRCPVGRSNTEPLIEHVPTNCKERKSNYRASTKCNRSNECLQCISSQTRNGKAGKECHN